MQSGQLRVILENLIIPQLIAPFENNHVDGSLLDMVESSDDIVDIDRNLIRGIYAKKFFNYVKAWKEDGGRIPSYLLIPSQHSPSTLTVDNTVTPTKVIADFYILHCLLDDVMFSSSSRQTQRVGLTLRLSSLVIRLLLQLHFKLVT